MTSRPLLLAMNNPISSDPKFALYPTPEGCAGNRLWRMLNEQCSAENRKYFSKKEYLDIFERRNVLSSRAWSARDARAGGEAVRSLLRGRRIVVLGVQTLSAIRYPRPEDWGVWTTYRPGEQDLVDAADQEETEYTLMPHPSGRCHEYNAPEMRRRLGRLLLEMSDEYESRRDAR